MNRRTQVTIVSRSDGGQHVSDVVRALKSHKITYSVVGFDSSRPLAPQMKSLGDLTLWRASSLDVRTQRSSVAGYLDRTIMVNEAVFRAPATAEKYYQQQTIAATGSLMKYAISTFMAADKKILQEIVERGDLKFPVIAKPNNGSRGRGISLLETFDDISKLDRPLREYVFQSFIKNDGDWRVIVLGGQPIGVMKRIAQAGSYLNNISQGARAVNEIDNATRRELFAVASRVAALFNLRFCGVDLIRDAETGILRILEINTAPQWGGEFGFQSITGVDIGEKFANYAGHMLGLAGSAEPMHSMVDAYFKDMLEPHSSELFHYASRTWLWKGDAWSRRVLDDMYSQYIGSTPDEIRKILTGIVARKDQPLSVNQNKRYRKQYFEKYRMLPIYNRLLFKAIFSDSLYNQDIRPYIKELVPDEDFLRLFSELLSDHDAVRILSTHAINFMYLLKNYFKSLRLASSVLVDPSELMEVASSYEDLIEQEVVTREEAIKLRIYLLTHAILGESRFYQRRVSAAGFRRMCKMLEDIVSENYFDVSLDNKLEFLVCADICRYKTGLRDLILSEAEKSVSWAGVFLVDRDGAPTRHALRTSEHRNVLYVMASRPRYLDEQNEIASKVHDVSLGKKTIGRLARVRLPGVSSYRLVARVDTGATRSSLCVSNVHEKNGELRYSLLYPGHPLYTGEVIKTREYFQKSLKAASIKDSMRYVVKMRIEVGSDSPIEVACNLADRQHMLYPVLIGRDILRGRYEVDVGRQFAVSH